MKRILLILSIVGLLFTFTPTTLDSHIIGTDKHQIVIALEEVHLSDDPIGHIH